MNTTPFVDWFWKYCWMSNNPVALPHIALETEALAADPDNKDQRFYVDYVIPGDTGDIFVHMDEPVLH